VELPWGDPLLQDADGDGAAGLDDTGFDNDPGTQADADFQTTEGQYTIHWNVADNVVTSNTRTITVIVTWTDHGAQRRASMQRVLPRII
jgi:hypothetical protein